MDIHFLLIITNDLLKNANDNNGNLCDYDV